LTVVLARNAMRVTVVRGKNFVKMDPEKVGD